MSERAYRHRIRVRYAETDAQAALHHAAYVVYLEEARIEALRELGRSYRDLEEAGTLLAVTGVEVRYRRPLFFDDLLELTTTYRLAGPSRLTFATAIARDGRLCAEGSVTVAAIGRDGRPQRLPAELRALLA